MQGFIIIILTGLKNALTYPLLNGVVARLTSALFQTVLYIVLIQRLTRSGSFIYIINHNT